MSKQSNDLRQRGWLLRALQAAFIAVLLQNCLLYLLESPLHSQAASIPLRHHHLRPVIPSPETQEPSLFDLDISHNEEAGNETASETETHGTGLQKRTLGTPVSEGHARYELVYALLTGLKSSVLVSDAQKAIPLQDQDFTATQKWHFDTKGSSGAAPSKYSFQFKDYAPQVFRALRRNHGIRADEYLRSLAGTLTGSYMMFEMGSPGRSGSTFYISQDERYLIKTVTPAQHKHLRRILKSYHRHTTTYPNTLLNRIYGLHRVKSFALGSIHFAVFANVFPADVDIHEVYDLKGSSVGRYLTEEQAKNSKRPVWKDKNFVERGRKLELGPAKSELLVKQMEVDVEFLTANEIIDYSFLVGIHDKSQTPDSTPSSLPVLTLPRPPSAQSLYEPSIFNSEEGGLQATDQNDRPLPIIYYFGIIDFVNDYNLAFKLWGVWKGLKKADLGGVSVVKPTKYGPRFLNFVKSTIRGYNERHQLPNDQSSSTAQQQEQQEQQQQQWQQQQRQQEHEEVEKQLDEDEMDIPVEVDDGPLPWLPRTA